MNIINAYDPIVGHVKETIDRETASIGNLSDILHKTFQTQAILRLNNIRQLSFTYYTYLGGTHTRLSHSVGVMYGILKNHMVLF